jgi:AhpD family alkylhydroperoxidase
MICFTVAEKSDCTYCAATHELTCRHLGVDEETLRTIAKDLKDVNPERIRSIIEFALKAAKYPQQLEPADYDAVRAHGVTNDEIIEIIMVAGFAVFLDIVADGLKVEVEKEVVDALAQ